jgi:DNA helicase II / ATP-dependent DNA helicase PcrA
VTTTSYTPTEEQRKVIEHSGSAFVTACPGAGKTRTMVERARIILHDGTDRRGVAFLSFTNAAVEELEARLRAYGVLPVPLFPTFVGTFDRFLWQFLIVPFGIQGCTITPRLIPDKDDWQVVPFDGAQSLPLKCFDRATGKVDATLAKEHGFDTSDPKRNISRHEAAALTIINNARANGEVDFEDVRVSVRERLVDDGFAARLGAALAARFREIFVDEAQDCNPADLHIVDWLRRSGIAVKVICDPNQSIYAFRGGITNQLLAFGETFPEADRLTMSGNFRSPPAICSAIVALRPPSARTNPDRPLGRYKDDMTPIHILSYKGTSVSAAIGREFKTLVQGLGIPLHDAPVVAATRAAGAKAIGQPTPKPTEHKTLLLAEAVTNHYFAFAVGNRREALIALHRTVLLVQGHINARGDYHTYIAAQGLEDGSWRPGIIEIANGLRFDPLGNVEQWLQKARGLLSSGLVAGGLSINQRLKNHADIAAVLVGAPADSPPARTIHSVKGMEFPAVCVVMTSQRTGKILDLLEGTPSDADEDARKIYVGASRAERLLAFATPKNSAGRLVALLKANGCTTVLHEI